MNKLKSAVVGAILVAAFGVYVALPPVIAQQPLDFGFEYTKTGGIAGVNQRLTLESQTDVIKFMNDGIVVEKTLSAESIDNIKQAVTNAGFFEMDSSYPPKDSGAADYFSHSLTVNQGAQNRSVSWVDEFASSVPLPDGLEVIVSTIEDAYANSSSTANPLDDGKRRVTGTLVKQSSAHDAEGHSAHQAAYILLAQPGFVYNGALTFSSNRPVDILVYHDVTGTDAETVKGISVHVVNGKSYAVTSILKNVTSGSASFVGSGILAHTTSSDTYAIVSTVDAIRKSSTIASTGQSFTIDVSGEKFTVRASDSTTISQLTDNYNGKNSMHVTGKLARGDGGFNQPWGWHLDPATVRMADVSIELCDGRPSMVQEDLEYWLGTVGSFCPWSSKVVGIS
ncbi:MAG: hypothetical protein ACRD99_06565 [Nitrososphaera sp.]